MSFKKTITTKNRTERRTGMPGRRSGQVCGGGRVHGYAMLFPQVFNPPKSKTEKDQQKKINKRKNQKKSRKQNRRKK